MATITLRLSAKTDKATSQHEILIRFRHGKVDQYGATNVFVQPEYWSDTKQDIMIDEVNAQLEKCNAWRIMTPDREKEKARLEQLQQELESKHVSLAAVTKQVQDSFKATDKQNIGKDWLKDLLHEFNFPTTNTAEAQEEQKQKSFFYWFELFLTTKNYPHGSTKSFRVLERALGRYQGYKQSKDKNFILDIDTITKHTINDFFKYFKNEYLFAQKNPKLFSRLLRDFPTEITQKHKTPTITERGHNHIVNLQKKFKRFFLWLNKEGYSTNHPFDGVEIKKEKYGTPIILTFEERNKIADFDLSATPHLERQRDVFIFQCLIGCRVSDLLKMTPNNVINGQIEYIARKTQENEPVIIDVPLNPRAAAILDKYRNMDLSAYKSKRNPNPLLPFISSQKYNETIKEVFKVCGINRMVTVLDSVSGEQMQKPFYEVASSHLARRTFVGLLYNQIQDPNLISSMSGHVEGSREFARYRKIEREAKEKAVNLIN